MSNVTPSKRSYRDEPVMSSRSSMRQRVENDNKDDDIMDISQFEPVHNGFAGVNLSSSNGEPIRYDGMPHPVAGALPIVEPLTREERRRIAESKAAALRLRASIKARRAVQAAEALSVPAIAAAVVEQKDQAVANRRKPYDWKKRALYLAKQRHYNILNGLKRRVAVESYKKSVWKAKRANASMYKSKRLSYRYRKYRQPRGYRKLRYRSSRYNRFKRRRYY